MNGLPGAWTPTHPSGSTKPAEIGVGLLGCGVVGSAVARALEAQSEQLGRILGIRPVVRAVAVRHLEKERDVSLRRDLFTADPLAVVNRSDVEVVIEVIGGLDPAGPLIELSIAHGKDVISANKELLARRGRCLQLLAVSNGVRLLFEAAVMAGVPVLGPLAEIAAVDRIQGIQGIVNGTSNFCLHLMEREGIGLEEALARAKALGYAEQDPSSDVDGHDAVAKLAILSSIAFRREVGPEEIGFSGIADVSAGQLRRARSEGQVLRLIARAELRGERLVATVKPTQISAGHPLAAVSDHWNGILLRADLVGEVFIQGAGAGGEATASAVLRDLAQVVAGQRNVPWEFDRHEESGSVHIWDRRQ